MARAKYTGFLAAAAPSRILTRRAPRNNTGYNHFHRHNRVSLEPRRFIVGPFLVGFARVYAFHSPAYPVITFEHGKDEVAALGFAH
jgi:hypothetical protein